MTQVLLYTIVSVVIVSLVSLIGVVALYFGSKRNETILTLLVSLSVGTLFGGAFFHLIPEAVEVEGSFSIFISTLIVVGIGVFFLLDKLVHWRHAHDKPTLFHGKTKNAKPSMVILNLVGDGVHNFLDGLIIAGSYLVSIPTGVAATVAVIIHEAPQELADFGVLLYAGVSKWKALFYNFLSGAVAIIGAVIGLVIGLRSEMFLQGIVPFAGGAFIYIAGSNLIPELLHKNKGLGDVAQQLVAFIVGVGIMYGLLFL